jgi:CubicO group peptidase (beta-lactamase class C family)
MRSILTVIVLIFTINFSSSAQSTQQRKNDSVFVLVKKYFNAKQADSIYLLAGDVVKKEFTAEAFRYVLENQLFPAGQIKESKLLNFLNNKIGVYNLTFNSGKLELWMSLDDQGKLDMLQFKPPAKDAGDKIEQVATTNPRHTSVDKKVDSAARIYIQKANTVGLSIGILSNGVATTYNYGETAQGNYKLPDANSIYEIGSITKTFTATLLAYYVNEGKVKLTDPITKYLPDSVASNQNLQGITLEMLSNHTSGLPRLPDNFVDHSGYPQDPYRDYTKQHLFSYLKTCKPDNKPGENYAYSNLGYGLLGAILEKVSGKSFEQMVEEVICQPLGIKSTVQHLTPTQRQRFLKEYNANGQETPPWLFDVLAPLGALRSTVNNLLTYAKANIVPNDTKLSKAFQLTHQITFNKADVKLGIGWHIIVVNNIEYYCHDGDTFGSSSFLAFNPEKKLAIVVLSNSGANVNAMAADLIKRIQ